MVRDLNLPIEIAVCPIVREPDGLAMSSRNVYLSPQDRKSATVLNRSLTEVKQRFDQGERGAGTQRVARRRASRCHADRGQPAHRRRGRPPARHR